jgi:hypothetical protein
MIVRKGARGKIKFHLFSCSAIIVVGMVTTWTIVMTYIRNQPQGNNIQMKVVEMQFPRVGVIKDKVHDKVQSQVKVVEVIQNKEWWI